MGGMERGREREGKRANGSLTVQCATGNCEMVQEMKAMATFHSAL